MIKIFKNFKKYFEQELNNLKSHESDGLVTINNNNVILSPLGEHFSPQIANIFDVYNDQEFYKEHKSNPLKINTSKFNTDGFIEIQDVFNIQELSKVKRKYKKIFDENIQQE